MRAMSGWDQVVGHEWAVALLAGAVANGRVGHAYLITGPDQVGKTTLALTFAQALNCTAAPEERPCGRCRSCRLIAAGHHPDLHLLEPEISARGTPSIKIEAIRDLQHELNLSTHEGRYRVAILTQFDAANLNAANAFLKTLEEPPPSVVLILTASEADALLPTIASRCRTINLRPLDVDLLEQSLATRWGRSADDAELLAHLADGRLGWAISAGEDASILQAREEHLDHLAQALAGSRVSRFALADKLARKPEALPDVLRTWLSWWRDAALAAHAEPGNTAVSPLSNIDQRAQIEQVAAKWPREAVLRSFKQTGLAIWQLARNANTRLVLEVLLLTYPLPEEAPQV